MNTIYKYRSWANEDHQSVLTKNELFFASPASFNDPFDNRLFNDYESLSEADYKLYCDSIIESAQSMGNKKWTKDALERWKKTTEDRTYFSQFSKSFEEKNSDERLGIISFSQTAVNTLLWAHYADNHKGIAIGFDKDKLLKANNFGSGREIYYPENNEYPKINPLGGEETFYQRCFTKSVDWKYESEFRFLRIHRDGEIQKDDARRKVYFDDDCIVEVCLGIRISDVDKEEIMGICEAKRIPCIEMERALGKFEIQKKSS